MLVYSQRRRRTLRSAVYPRFRDRFRYVSYFDAKTRNRLNAQISYLVKTGDYFEPFMHAKNSTGREHFLSESALKDLGEAELGYDINTYYSAVELKQLTKKNEEGEQTYHDAYFLDLIELLIVFSKKDKREEVVTRLQKVFDESASEFQIYRFMIVKNDSSDISSIIELLSDEMLQKKLRGAI